MIKSTWGLRFDEVRDKHKSHQLQVSLDLLMAEIWYPFLSEMKWERKNENLLVAGERPSTAASRRAKALVVLEVLMTQWSNSKLPSSIEKCKRIYKSMLRKLSLNGVSSWGATALCVHVHVEVKGEPWVLFLRRYPACILRQGFSLAWNLPNWLGRLASEAQTICLSYRFPVLTLHACFTIGFLGIKLGVSCLQGKQCTKEATLSPEFIFKWEKENMKRRAVLGWQGAGVPLLHSSFGRCLGIILNTGMELLPLVGSVFLPQPPFFFLSLFLWLRDMPKQTEG